MWTSLCSAEQLKKTKNKNKTKEASPILLPLFRSLTEAQYSQKLISACHFRAPKGRGMILLAMEEVNG